MKKLFIILSLLFVSLGLSVSAQTNVSLPDVTANVGATINVPVTAPNLGAVGSMTLGMTYDTDVLEFIDFANNPFAGDPNFLTTVQNGKISVVWFSTNPKNIDSKLFDLQFKYLGGTSTLEFTGTQEITDENAQPLNVTFINGSVGPIPAPPSELTLSDHIATPGETFKMALTATSLANVGSMTLFVDYDAAKLNYVGVENNDFGFTSSESNGTITLAWFSTTPYSASADTLVNLVFEFVGPTGTTVSINPNSEITDASSNPITTITLNSGAVSLPNVGFTLPTIEALPDTKVSLPLMGKLLSSVGSFTIKISYDSGELVFDDYSNLISGSLTAQENNGVLTLAYFNTSGLTVSSDTIVNLNFTYKGSAGTSTAVTFVPAESEVTDLDSNPLLVDFTNGSIVELDAPPYVEVANLAELRSQVTGDGTVYKVTGEVVVTFVQSFRNQKWLQDSSAAVMIDDNAGLITTEYKVGDGITGLTGTLIVYGGMFELVPDADNGVITSTANMVESQVISLQEFKTNFENYESELVTLENVSFIGGDGVATFANGKVYPLTDGVDSVDFRTTFYGVDFIGDLIFQGLVNVTGIMNSRSSSGVEYSYISARSSEDFEQIFINPDPTELKAWWQIAAGDVDFFANDNNARSAAFNSATGNVLVASRTGAPAIHILDSKTGSKISALDMTGVAGGTFAINIVSVADDGAIYAGNLALANGEFKLYKWDNESAAPVNIFAGVVAQRTGDAMRVVGSGTGTIVYASGSASDKIYQFTTADGSSFTLNKEITVAAGLARGGIAPVSDAVDSDIWVNGTGTNASLVSTDGTVLFSADGAVMSSSFMNIDYIEIMNDMNEVVKLIAMVGGNVEASSKNMEMWNVTNLNNVYPYFYGSLSSTWNANANGTGTVELIKLDDNNFHALQLVTNNGISLYSTLMPLYAPTSLVATSIENGVELKWSMGNTPGSLITMNSGVGASGFYQSVEKAYGSVFDLSSIANPELIQIDFAHSAFDFFSGKTEYVVYVFDWDTQVLLLKTDPLSTIVDINLGMQWESVLLPEINGVNKVGIFIQPLTTDSFGDGWPNVLTDDTVPPLSGGQVIIDNLSDPFNNLLEPGNGDLGHFLIDLWIKDTTSTNSTKVVSPVALNINSSSNIKARGVIVNSIINPLRINNEKSQSSISGFNVYRGIAENNLALIASLNGNGTSYFDADLPDGTYFYGVTAVYAGGESPMVNAEVVHTTVSVEDDMVPAEYSLEQNFPNPFNPTTVIKFGLKVDSKVSLKIYNVLGQEIATILNGTMNAGLQRVEFNASYLSSGVYLYRIEANGLDGSNFIDVKKMMLLK